MFVSKKTIPIAKICCKVCNIPWYFTGKDYLNLSIRLRSSTFNTNRVINVFNSTCWFSMEQTKPLKLLTLHILLLFCLVVGKIQCDSFIKIESEGSALTDNNVKITVSLSVADSSYILVFLLYLQSSFGTDKLIKKQNLTIDQKSINITVVENFEISKRYTYHDIRQLENPTDYYAKNIKVKACIYDKLQRWCIKELSDEIMLSLNSPWRRKELHVPCPSWFVKLKLFSTKQEIPQCQNHAGRFEKHGFIYFHACLSINVYAPSQFFT